MSFDRTLQRVWYQREPFALFLLLIPLSFLFAALSGARRSAYRIGLLRSVRVERPVLVIGNVSVGGTGKTPLVIWVAEYLRSRGCSVGIVTRGYGGRAAAWPQDVSPQSSAEQVGDEAVLLAMRTGVIVVAGADRVAAARRAIERGADVVVSDDGLQHYQLARNSEIVVVDAQRAFSNGWLLPAGPLRERTSRLREADISIQTVRREADRRAMAGQASAIHELASAVNLRTGERRPLEDFAGGKVHAVAGIGHPQAFFGMLRSQGLQLEAHAFPDHATLAPDDILFGDVAPVLMTEKDAVKCRAFAQERHWAVALTVRFDEKDERLLTVVLDRLIASSADSQARRGEL